MKQPTRRRIFLLYSYILVISLVLLSAFADDEWKGSDYDRIVVKEKIKE